MVHLNHPEQRFWRTDYKIGRNMYALISNDLMNPSIQDPLVGVMESTELAELVVETHNKALAKYGRNYLKALTADD